MLIVVFAAICIAASAWLVLLGAGMMALHDAVGGTEGTPLSFAAPAFIGALILGVLVSVAIILTRRRRPLIGLALLVVGLVAGLATAFVLGAI